jgi:hypothetical protein
MQDALSVNGIATDFVSIRAADSSGFLVKSWTFTGQGSDSQYAPYSWVLTEVAEATGGFGMVPLPQYSLFGDMKSNDGIPGQNTRPPSEKIFGAHFIVKDRLGVNPGMGPYYDPSYGVLYQGACPDFESKAVDGYACQLDGIDNRPQDFHVRRVSSACNIVFDK